MGLPLLARENTVIPVGSVDDKPDYDLTEAVTFHMFNLTNGNDLRTVVPDSEGKPAMVLHVSRKGNEITIRPEKAVAGWSVLLRGCKRCKGANGGTMQEDPLGTRVFPDSPTVEMTVNPG